VTFPRLRQESDSPIPLKIKLCSFILSEARPKGGPLAKMYYLYILKSQKDGRMYVGYTKDLDRRLYQHNAGFVVATKHRRPLVVFTSEQYQEMSEAKRRERYWKSGAGRRKMKEWF
jgi:putative endonuclease